MSVTASDPDQVFRSIPEQPTIAVLGGTGDQGMGLAYRWAAQGVTVLIGSRQQARADAAAEEIGHGVTGGLNEDVARAADVALIAVPWGGHASLVADLADALAGRIVMDCVNPLGVDKQGAFALPVAEGSATQQAQALLPRSVVVGVFHNVSAPLLLDRNLPAVDTDTLVLGDVRAATDEVIALANRIPGIRGLYGGRLRNAGQVEALTANLISVNRRYKAHAGIKVTDVAT